MHNFRKIIPGNNSPLLKKPDIQSITPSNSTYEKNMTRLQGAMNKLSTVTPRLRLNPLKPPTQNGTLTTIHLLYGNQPYTLSQEINPQTKFLNVHFAPTSRSADTLSWLLYKHSDSGEHVGIEGFSGTEPYYFSVTGSERYPGMFSQFTKETYDQVAPFFEKFFERVNTLLAEGGHQFQKLRIE